MIDTSYLEIAILKKVLPHTFMISFALHLYKKKAIPIKKYFYMNLFSLYIKEKTSNV